MQGDQLRRLHPEQSLLDSPTEYPVYSLKLKQLLLDNMTSRSRGKETAATKAESVASEADSSTGLSSRLDRVRITGEAAEDIVNGNAAPAPAPANTDGNGNKPAKRSNIKEKTIVVKDKAPSNKTSEVFFIFYFERKVINFTPTTSAPSVPQPVLTITEKAPTRAFSWLKAPTRREIGSATQLS